MMLSSRCSDAFNEIFREELVRNEKAAKTYEAALLRHPDCRDPDHPGCELCEDIEDKAIATKAHLLCIEHNGG